MGGHSPTIGGEAERAGLMVVRIWTDGDGGRVYARLTETLDLTTRIETVHTAGSVEQLTALVRAWGEAFSARSARRTGSSRGR